MLLVFAAPCQLRLLTGPKHGRTIPLADIEVICGSPVTSNEFRTFQPRTGLWFLMHLSPRSVQSRAAMDTPSSVTEI